ncbi:gibberellin-regulated protein 14-like isoform X6 [Malus sylvestris]|uniref:gibberellin-regulated protein 14-like isoform X6 n=1 Tax=Malus sylvestris TaxID=3752 RepID=UPI0021AD3429|nr:gibberellin-regulated protein 14-like isoform X6 [Malus sylvestris]
MASKGMLLLFATILLFTARASSLDHHEELKIKINYVKATAPPPLSKAPAPPPLVAKPPTPPIAKPPTPPLTKPSPPIHKLPTPPLTKPPTPPLTKPSPPIYKPPAPPLTKPPSPPLAKPPSPPYTKPTPVIPPVKPPTPVIPPVNPPSPVSPPVKPPTYPPLPPVRSKADCIALCDKRCMLHSRKRVCMRACTTCCDRCRCVPPGTFGNRERCGKCYTDMVTHGNRSKCP